MSQSRVDQSLMALRRIFLATQLYERNLAKSVGLTSAQLRVLQIVVEHGEASPTAISSRMGISQATVTGLAHKLAAIGMITRRRSERDKRQLQLVITASGRATVENAPDPLQQSYVGQFEELQPWEQAMLIASLERVAEMLDASSLDVAPVLASGVELTAPQK